VTSADGSPLPGVTVTITSPALIGERVAASGASGDYIVRGLPPGVYSVLFTLVGMNSVQRSVTVPLGSPARADAQMELTAAEETITVTGETASALETTTISTNFKKEEIANLPLTRTPAAIAELAPGLTDNTPVGGQVTINGSLAYDNSFLINGVDVLDPIFGQANALFIEEAIEETQVLTSGISAEFGRFTGGVVNTITKSGGNEFSGTFRTDFDRADWRDETPFEDERGVKREGDLNKTYSATLGGPIVRDRVWFFAGGRDSETGIARTLSLLGTPFTTDETQTRLEGKVTFNITDQHTIQGSYLDVERTQANNVQLTPIDLRAVSPAEFPNTGWVVGYQGSFTNNLFGELRYSEKEFTFLGPGNTSRDIEDSVFWSVGIADGTLANRQFHAPYFDATDPEDRNNEQLYGALSWFLSSESMGSHDIKVGAEEFTVIRTGGNGQSSTGFTFFADYKVSGTTPLFDSNGEYIPLWVPGETFITHWFPTRGAQLDITTQTLFINDRWALNDHWSFNLGARYEQTDSEATGNIASVDTDVLVPRLGATFDPKGDGTWKFDVTYSEYAGRYNPSIFGDNTGVGNPARIYGYYVGPEGEGLNFAPGFDTSNYIYYDAVSPTENFFFTDGLGAPVAEEIGVSVARSLPRGGFLELAYITRELSDMIEDFILIENGCTDITFEGIPVGCVDNVVYRNTSVPVREYEAVQLAGRYTIFNNWTVDGNWTYQLKNDGNYEGEGSQAIGASIFQDRPELFPQNRVFPSGRLDDYQEHKVRVWSNYNMDLGRAGVLGIGGIFRYDSPLTFSFAQGSVPLTANQRARNPGYNSIPNTQTIFFGERGAGEYNDVYQLDLALNYGIPIWKTLSPWVHFEVRNVTNENTLVTFNTTVRRNTAGPVDEFGIPTTFIPDANFGKATAATSHQIPREYFLGAGIRF
jgi:outer membrane receptor protein involved in Fe transport